MLHSFMLGWAAGVDLLAAALLVSCKTARLQDCKLELSEDLGFPAGQPQSFTDTIHQKHAKGSGWPRISSKGGLSGKVALRRAGVMQEAFNNSALTIKAIYPR